MPPSIDALRTFIAGADRTDTIGLRPPSLRAIVLLGLVTAASLMESYQFGALQSAPVQTNTFKPLIRNEVFPARMLPPESPYRLEISNETNGQVITSVLVDPAQWDPMGQTAFVLKLIRQADMRAQERHQILVLSVMAVRGEDQEDAIRFVAQTLDVSGVTALPVPEAYGAAVSAAQPAGLRFDRNPSVLDAQGSDPCLVRTGQLAACIEAEQLPDVSTSRVAGGSLGQALAAQTASTPPARPRSSRMR